MAHDDSLIAGSPVPGPAAEGSPQASASPTPPTPPGRPKHGSHLPAIALEPRIASRSPTLAIVALALGALAIGVTEAGTMGILPLIADGVGATIPQAGTLVSAYALGVVVGAPLLAVVGARLPRSGMLLAFMALYAMLHLATLGVSSFGETWALRFLSGFPHGAYLGVASLVVADLVPLPRRTWAIAAIMLGFPAANLAAAPLGTYLAQQHGWQTLYLVVAGAAAACVLGILVAVPPIPNAPGAQPNPLSEVRVLRRPKVLMTIVTTSLGFGGAFASMSYIAPTVTALTGVAETTVPIMVALYGVGAVAGAFLADLSARLGTTRALVVLFAADVVILLAFGWAMAGVATAGLAIIALGAVGAALVPVLQTRLMEVAHDGQTLAAAVNHATLNLANALGAWAGGLTIAAGLNYAWPSRAGAVLAALGLAGSMVALAYERRHPEPDLGARE